MRYEPFSEDCEILGQVMLSLVMCVNAENIKPYLEKYNLTQIDPRKWYPARLMSAILSDMADAGGVMFDFVSIGMKLADLTPEPPGDTFTEKILVWKEQDNKTSRGSDTGYSTTEMVGDKHLKIVNRRSSPDDLLYGYLYGFARRFLKGTRFMVKYDESVPRRENGGDVTIIHVTWD
jgi:hypothetical protein